MYKLLNVFHNTTMNKKNKLILKSHCKITQFLKNNILKILKKKKETQYGSRVRMCEATIPFSTRTLHTFIK